MAEVIGNPDVIESFARELDEYCQETRDNLQRICGRLDGMESERTWADDQYYRYRDMFREVSGHMQQTLEHVRDEHIQHLRHVIQRLRAYLEQ